jgi:signal transduction histidine kinase
LGNLISVYHYIGLQSKADSSVKQLKAIIAKTDTLKNLQDLYYNLGLYNLQQKSYYSIALDYFIKSVDLRKANADTSTLPKVKIDYAANLSMIAEVYLKLKEANKSIEYLSKAEAYTGNSAIIKISILGKFIRSYVMLNDSSHSKKYYDLLHQTIAASPGNWSEAVSSNIEMSDLALKQNKISIAKLYLDKALIQAEKDNKELLVSSVHLAFGNYYLAIGDFVNAKKYFKMVLPASEKYGLEQEVSYLKSITEVSLYTNDYSEARRNFHKFTQAIDSLNSQKISLNIAEMEAIYQNKEKQKEIQIQKTEIIYSRKQRFWLILGLLLSGLSIILFLLLYKNKKRSAYLLNNKNLVLEKTNTQLSEANKTKAKLFSIISHDLRSPISQVYQFLKLQQLNPDALSSEQKTELNNKIQNATGSLLETMEDLLLWSKTQMNEFKVTMQPVSVIDTINACKNLLQLNCDAKNITLQINVPETQKIQTDPYYFQTIIRNLIQNAIKAAPPYTAIDINSLVQNQNIILSIQNEGPTFTQKQFEQIILNEEINKTLTGLGLKLTQELCEKINAKLKFTDSLTQTTVAELRLQIA